MENLAIVPFGWKRGGGWQRYDVAREVGAAHESLCRHRYRDRAERCVEHRQAGGATCIDSVPVNDDLQTLLSDLSRLTTRALGERRDLEALQATAELIHDLAAELIATTSPKRPSAGVDLIGVAKCALGATL